MSFALWLRDGFRNKSHKDSSGNKNKSYKFGGKQDSTATATNNRRSIAFDFDNELTRQRALQISSDSEETMASSHDIAPPAYSRLSRDSGVSMESEPRGLYQRRLGRSRDASPMSRRSLSTSRPVSAQMPRLSFGTDDGRRMSLGPAMEQWRVEEEEDWRLAKQNGEPLLMPLTPALTSTSTLPSAPASPSWGALSEWSSRSPLNDGKGRRISLVAAMEQWRLEEDEEAKRIGRIMPVLLTPTSMSTPVPTSGAWPTLSRGASVSPLGEDENRNMSLGPAMEQWRLEETEELQMARSKHAAIPVLLPLASSQSVSKWPLFALENDKARRISLSAAMEQWRVEEQDWEQGAKQHGKATVPISKSQQAWPSVGQPVDVKRHITIGPAMEQWRLEELEEWEKNGRVVATPLKSPASIPMISGETSRVMTLGPAMELWRLEEVCW